MCPTINFLATQTETLRRFTLFLPHPHAVSPPSSRCFSPILTLFLPHPLAVSPPSSRCLSPIFSMLSWTPLLLLPSILYEGEGKESKEKARETWITRPLPWAVIAAWQPARPPSATSLSIAQRCCCGCWQSSPSPLLPNTKPPPTPISS